MCTAPSTVILAARDCRHAGVDIACPTWREGLSAAALRVQMFLEEFGSRLGPGWKHLDLAPAVIHCYQDSGV